MVVVTSGANHALTSRRVCDALAEVAELAVCAISAEIPLATVTAAAVAAAERSARVVLNPSPVIELPDALVRTAPLLVLNQHEAAVIAGVQDPQAAAATLWRRTNAPVVVTLGAGGALIGDRDGVERRPAPRVDVVDPTGAGDAFCGTLAGHLAAGADLRTAVDAGLEAGSAAVARLGARSWLRRSFRKTF
jgi:ribokinase